MMIKKNISGAKSKLLYLVVFFLQENMLQSQFVCVCVVTHRVVIPAAPSPSPHLGRLNIVSFQPGLGACG